VVLTTAFKLKPEEEQEVVKIAGADKLIYKPLPKFAELQAMLEDVIAQRRAANLAAAKAVTKAATKAVKAEPNSESKKPKYESKKPDLESKKPS
jgi:hypothetical protein